MKDNDLRLNIRGNKKFIENLMQKVGTTSKQQLLNSALTLLNWVAKEKEKGRAIGSLDESKSEPTFREIIMPELDILNES